MVLVAGALGGDPVAEAEKPIQERECEMETEAASPVQQLRLSGVDCNRGANVLIHDVNLTLEPGTITGLIGPNGAGKSTLIATMLGDIAPARGSVTYGGKPVRSLAHRSQVFGVVTEAHGLPPKTTVQDMILYWGGIHGVPTSEMAQLSQELGVDNFREKSFAKLSTGMRRRAEIVLALLPRPKVVVLDEPFNGLDMDGVHVLRNLVQRLRDSGKVVVISTHTLNELDFLADRSVAVHQGKLVELEFTRGELGASEAAYQRLQEGK